MLAYVRTHTLVRMQANSRTRTQARTHKRARARAAMHKQARLHPRTYARSRTQTSEGIGGRVPLLQASVIARRQLGAGTAGIVRAPRHPHPSARYRRAHAPLRAIAVRACSR